MENNFEFYYIANSCLLIMNGNTKILIDGPYNNENDFDPLDEDVRNDMVFAKDIFSGLDGILFTHGHEDHFDYGEMKECLLNNDALIVAAPEDCFYQEGSELLPADVFYDRFIKITGDKGVFKIKDLDIYYCKSKHMEVDRDEVIEHYSFVVEDGSNRAFISGDMEMDDYITEVVCSYGEYDAVFVNPVITNKKQWFENFMRINASKRYVYHIPSKENDKFYYRKAAVMMAARRNAYELLLDKMKKLDS